MYESLLAHASDFHLYIFAFDDTSFSILDKLILKKVTIIPLKDFETDELINVKNGRTKAEYCWTCTPSTIAYIIETYKVPHCTYIDADLCFYSDPSVLVNELYSNSKSVLITEHRFSLLPRLYEEKRGGRFCVQFLTINNDFESLKVLNKWKNQCIEWCYARYEDNKFGDQKYLEEWPLIYNNIHILQHQGGGLAPWNIQQYRFKKNDDSLMGVVRKNKFKFKPVFYHFQYVKQINTGKFDIGWYLIPRNVKRLFYLPYLKRIAQIEDNLIKENSSYKQRSVSFRADSIKNVVKICIKKLTKYNIIKIH